MPARPQLIKAILHSLSLLTIFLNFVGLAFAAPGDLDLTFGMGGKTVADFFHSDHAFAMAVQSDGKFVVAGTTTSDQFATEDFLLARFHPNGSLDTSFGDAGKTRLDILGGVDRANAVALQADGKIVVAGSVRAFGADAFSDSFVLVRLSPDGSLDPTFGLGGKVVTNFFGYQQASAVLVQPDGKIVAAGFASQTSNPEGADFALARYHADGSLDPTFDGDGKVITSFSNFPDMIDALALQPDGRIIAGGTLRLDDNFYRGDFALARYNPDGSLDATFGAGGKVITDITGSNSLIDQIKGLTLEPDGKIIAGGRAASIIFSGDKFAMARYHPNGTLDASFGAGGKVTTVFPNRSGANAVARQSNGKIILAGAVVRPYDHIADTALARYHPDGSLDTTFGDGGRKIENLSSEGSDAAQAIALQADGRIVIAGAFGDQAKSFSSYDFLLARFMGDDAPEVVSAVSQKVHGGSGIFEIDLPLTGTPGVECRAGGAGGNYQLLLTFASAVTVEGISIKSSDGMATGMQSASGAVVTVDLSAVADVQTLGMTLTNVSDGTTTGDVVISMGVLTGDTNGDRIVNAGDALQTRSRSGQGTATDNFRSDVNTDGFVNSGDTLVVRAHSGTGLPPED